MKAETVHNALGAIVVLYTEMVGELLAAQQRLGEALNKKDEVIAKVGEQLDALTKQCAELAEPTEREKAHEDLRLAADAYMHRRLQTVRELPLDAAEQAILKALEEIDGTGAETDLGRVAAAVRDAREREARAEEVGPGARPDPSTDRGDVQYMRSDVRGDVHDGSSPGGDREVREGPPPPGPARGADGEEPAPAATPDDGPAAVGSPGPVGFLGDRGRGGRL